MSTPIKLLTDDPTILGKLDDLPNVQSNVIRLFISSTFTDMTVERNELMKTTFPKLQQYFSGQGFDFQVVDMRWGVREESVLDHQASYLCMQEIRNAQKMSRGVCFLAFLGDKYGSCPLPAILTQKEYQVLKRHVELLKKSSELLDEWYSLDQNACPPHYLLHSVTDKFKKINNTDIDKIEERIEQREQWNKVQSDLRKLIQLGAEEAFKSKQFTETEKHKFFTAVTEREVEDGILSDEFATERTLCFLRQFNKLNPKDAIADRYADISGGKLDPKSRLFLQRLKSDKLSKKLPSENLFKYSVDWTSNGVDPSSNLEHEAYLTKLCGDVYDSVISISERRIAKTELKSKLSSEMKLLHQELLHHARFCETKTKTYVMRRKLEDHCRRYLRKYKFLIPIPTFPVFSAAPPIMTGAKNADDTSDAAPQEEFPDNPEATSNEQDITEEAEQLDKAGSKTSIMCHKPFIIDAPSGFGKTSLMAKLSKFFGSGLRPYSVCTTGRCIVHHKHCERFRKFVPEDKWVPCKMGSENFSEWLSGDKVMKIMRFLGTSPGSCGVRDVISSIIQQLWAAFGSPEDTKEILDYQFAHLCEYFHGLLWNLQSFDGIILIMLDAVDQLTPDDSAYNMHWLPLHFPTNIYFYVSMLPGEYCPALDNVKKLFREDTNYLSIYGMAFDTARVILHQYLKEEKRSLTSQQEKLILDAFQKSPQPLFLKLAFDHAKKWKSFTDMTTITVAKSCRDWINILFKNLGDHHGRTAGYAISYITASKQGLTDQEIEDLLSLNDSVLQDVYIYHLPPEPSVVRLPSMLWRRIRHDLQEYLVEKQADGKSVVNWYHRQFWETARYHMAMGHNNHSHLGAYFSGIWHNTPKPLTLYKGKKAEYPHTSRNVPPMPNIYAENHPNLRKLTELPHSLILSFNMDAAADCLCNFDFLQCKLRYQGFRDVMADFQLYFDTFAKGKERYAELLYIKMGHPPSADFTVQSIEVKLVYDLLLVAGDILKVDWQELPGQIIGRITPDWYTYKRINQLVNCARQYSWVSNSKLFIPRFPCLQPPGGLLRTSINHTIYVPGRPSITSDILCLSSSGFLYCREMKFNARDVVNVYDTQNNGELVQTMRLKISVESVKFVHHDSFLLCRGTKRKRYGPRDSVEFRDYLINCELNETLVFKHPSQIIDVSPNENYFIVVEQRIFHYYEFTGKDSTTKLWSDRLENEENSDIISAKFINDGSKVLLACKNGKVHLYDLEKKEILTYFGQPIDTEAGQEPCRENTFTMLLNDDDKMICRGLRSDLANTLYVYNLTTLDIEMACESVGPYPIDIIKLQKSQKWVAGATTTFEIFGTVKSKPIFVWNIETGKTVFRIKGNKGPCGSLIFLGHNNEFLAFSRLFDPGVVIVGIGYPGNKHHTPTQLLKLGGHIQAVCCMISSNDGTVLITTSRDNTIKIWDLSTTVALCEKAIEDPKMQKPLGRRRNSEQQEYIEKYDDVKKSDVNANKYFVFEASLYSELDRKKMTGCHAFVYALSKDKRYLVGGCMFGRISFINLESGNLKVVQAHSYRVKRVHSVIISDCQRFVFTAASDESVMVWLLQSGQHVKELKLTDPCHALYIKDNLLYTAHGYTEGNSYAQSWEWNAIDSTVTIENKDTITLSHSCFLSLVASSTGSFVATFNGFYVVIVLIGSDLETDHKEFILKPNNFPEDLEQDEHREIRSCVKITKNDQYVICSVYKYLHIINTSENDPTVLHFLTFAGKITHFETSKDSKQVYIGRYRFFDLVDIATGNVISSIEVHREYVECFSLCCDENYLVTISQDKTIKLWHLQFGSADQEEEDKEINGLKLTLLSQTTFHCPIRTMVIPEDASFFIVGPENIAPVAILNLNISLTKEISALTEGYPGVTGWVENEQELHSKATSYELDFVENRKIEVDQEDDTSSYHTANSDLTKIINLGKKSKMEISATEVKFILANSDASISRQSLDYASCMANVFGVSKCSSSESAIAGRDLNSCTTM